METTIDRGDDEEKKNSQQSLQLMNQRTKTTDPLNEQQTSKPEDLKALVNQESQSAERKGQLVIPQHKIKFANNENSLAGNLITKQTSGQQVSSQPPTYRESQKLINEDANQYQPSVYESNNDLASKNQYPKSAQIIKTIKAKNTNIKGSLQQPQLNQSQSQPNLGEIQQKFSFRDLIKKREQQKFSLTPQYQGDQFNLTFKIMERSNANFHPMQTPTSNQPINVEIFNNLGNQNQSETIESVFQESVRNIVTENNKYQIESFQSQNNDNLSKSTSRKPSVDLSGVDSTHKIDHLSNLIENLVDNQRILQEKLQQNQAKITQLASNTKSKSEKKIVLLNTENQNGRTSRFSRHSSAEDVSPRRSQKNLDQLLLSRPTQTAFRDKRNQIQQDSQEEGSEAQNKKSIILITTLSNNQSSQNAQSTNSYQQNSSQNIGDPMQKTSNFGSNNTEQNQQSQQDNYLNRQALSHRNVSHIKQTKGNNLNTFQNRKSSHGQPQIHNNLQLNTLNSETSDSYNMYTNGQITQSSLNYQSGLNQRISLEVKPSLKPNNKIIETKHGFSQEYHNLQKLQQPVPLRELLTPGKLKSVRKRFDFSQFDSKSQTNEDDEIRRSLERIQNTVKHKPQIQISQLKEELKFQQLLEDGSNQIKKSSHGIKRKTGLKEYEKMIPNDLPLDKKLTPLKHSKKGDPSLNQISEIFLTPQQDFELREELLPNFKTLKNALFLTPQQEINQSQYSQNNILLTNSAQPVNDAHLRLTFNNNQSINESQMSNSNSNRNKNKDKRFRVDKPPRSESPRVQSYLQTQENQSLGTENSLTDLFSPNSNPLYNNSQAQIRIKTRVSQKNGLQTSRVKSLMKSKNHFPKDFFQQ
eukprot:403347406